NLGYLKQGVGPACFLCELPLQACETFARLWRKTSKTRAGFLACLGTRASSNLPAVGRATLVSPRLRTASPPPWADGGVILTPARISRGCISQALIASADRAPLWLKKPPQRGQIVERHHLSDKGPIEDCKHDRRHHGRPHQLGSEPVHLRGTRIGPGHHIGVLLLGTYPPGQHGKEHQPPDDKEDREDRVPRHCAPLACQACSSSTSVPRKSLGCRNSTGLPWAPILGSPSPSTRAPSALRRSRAEMMSSTS